MFFIVTVLAECLEVVEAVCNSWIVYVLRCEIDLMMNYLCWCDDALFVASFTDRVSRPISCSASLPFFGVIEPVVN